jgi:hypothetical protein
MIVIVGLAKGFKVAREDTNLIPAASQRRSVRLQLHASLKPPLTTLATSPVTETRFSVDT